MLLSAEHAVVCNTAVFPTEKLVISAVHNAMHCSRRENRTDAAVSGGGRLRRSVGRGTVHFSSDPGGWLHCRHASTAFNARRTLPVGRTAPVCRGVPSSSLRTLGGGGCGRRTRAVLRPIYIRGILELICAYKPYRRSTSAGNMPLCD